MNDRKIIVDVKDDGELYYGKKLYMIWAKRMQDDKSFKERCPVCDDTKSINYKGYTFACPYCTGSPVSYHANAITLRRYRVKEFFINRFEVSGPEYKVAYTFDGLVTQKPLVKWFGFMRYGNGFDEVESKRVYAGFIGKADAEKVDITSDCSGALFFKKSEAEQFCKRLHERQKELLDKFNKEHGTSHNYPYPFAF